MSKNILNVVDAAAERRYSVQSMSNSERNSDDLRVFGFHVGTDGGSRVLIWATSQKHAIERFRAMCGDVVFITDAEWDRRMNQRKNAIPLADLAA